MISVLTYDMLNLADIGEILGLYKDGYIQIEPKLKKVAIIDLGIEKKDIIALSDFNFSINIFSHKFNLSQLLSLKSDVYILWGSENELGNIDCMVNKIKKLIGKKTIIGIGSGKVVLKSIMNDLDEANWKYDNEVMKHCKYEIYCLDNSDIEKINKIVKKGV